MSPETERHTDTPLAPVPNYQDEYREMLAHQTINELREIARQRGFSVQGTRKDPIVEEVAAQLCDLDATRAEVLSLAPPEQELLTYLNLVLLPGYGLHSEAIADRLPQQEKQQRWNMLYRQLSRLAERGLLLTFKQDNLTYYMLPQGVRVCLPPRPDLVPAYPEEQIGALEVREAPASAAIRKLYAVWNYVVQHHPRRHAAPPREPLEDQWPHFEGWAHLPAEIADFARKQWRFYPAPNESVTVPVPDYYLPSADRSAIHEQMGYSDEESEFWCALLEEMGALSGTPGSRIATHKEPFERLLNLAPSAQMGTTLFIWNTNTTWSEVDIVLRANDDIRLRRSLRYTTYKPENLYREWRSGRLTAMRFLSVLQENRWVSLEGFLQLIYEVVPNLTHMLSDRAVWWFESLRTKKQFGTTFEDWQQSSGRFVLALLEGPLTWLGAVSVGYADGKAVAFKLTPAGSFALGRRTTLVEAEHGAVPRENAVEMVGDLRVALVPGRAPAELHDLLHLIGDLEQATPERFLYHVTAEGVLEALERGQTVESLTDSFRRFAGVDVPAAWQDRLRTWSQNYGKLHLYEDLTLIELADDYALHELEVNTSLREHVVYQFSPRLLAIRPAAVDKLVQEMEKRGYTPHVE